MNNEIHEEIKALEREMRSRTAPKIPPTDPIEPIDRTFNDPKIEYGYLLNTYDRISSGVKMKKKHGYALSEVEKEQIKGLREQINVIARENDLEVVN